VNRHIEVAVYDKVTGARLRSTMPRITITDRKTGRSRDLQAVTAMYDVKEGQDDLHFGDNVHLANGTYRITVSVGGERAVFKKVGVGRP
jgi:sorbitol-specific phosphotransferase system component IIA